MNTSRRDGPFDTPTNIGIQIMFSLEAYKVLVKSILRTMDNNSIEIKSGTIRMDYSGRGMYGMTCLGIVMDQYDFDGWRIDMLDTISDKVKVYNHDKEVVDLLKKFKKSMRGPSRDSMGLSQIEYFTDIKIPQEYQEELNEILNSFINP